MEEPDLLYHKVVVAVAVVENLMGTVDAQRNGAKLGAVHWCTFLKRRLPSLRLILYKFVSIIVRALSVTICYVIDAYHASSG